MEQACNEGFTKLVDKIWDKLNASSLQKGIFFKEYTWIRDQAPTMKPHHDMQDVTFIASWYLEKLHAWSKSNTSSKHAKK